MAPLNELLSFLPNYGLGFALIHMLGGTVATKQPAMTATRSPPPRSARPGAKTRPGGARRPDRAHDPQPDRCHPRQHQGDPGGDRRGRTDPPRHRAAISSARRRRTHCWPRSIPSAARCSSPRSRACACSCRRLIAAYYDNLRPTTHPAAGSPSCAVLRCLLGERRLRKLADYVEQNIGALVGNFLRFPAQAPPAWGYWFGLPIDIRHIAFLIGLPRLRRGGARLLDPADDRGDRLRRRAPDRPHQPDGELCADAERGDARTPHHLRAEPLARRPAAAPPLRTPHAFLFRAQTKAWIQSAWSDAAERKNARPRVLVIVQWIERRLQAPDPGSILVTGPPILFRCFKRLVAACSAERSIRGPEA